MDIKQRVFQFLDVERKGVIGWREFRTLLEHQEARPFHAYELHRRLVKEFGATWGSMVSVFHPSDPFVVLDSVAKKVAIAFSLVINVDGAGKAPACLITNNPILFTFTFDDKGKVTKWDGLWDPNDPSLVGCVTKLSSAEL